MSELTSEKWLDFLDRIEFAGSRLSRCAAEIKDAYHDDQEKKLNLDASCKSTNLSEEQSIFFFEIEWSVNAKHGNKIVCFVKASYELAYRYQGEAPDVDCMERFLNTTVRSTSYPFFRQFLAQSSNDMGADLPILPLMKVPALKKMVTN